MRTRVDVSGLDDDTWAILRDILRSLKAPAGRPPSTPDRRIIEALLWRARTGCGWRRLPARYGVWHRVYQRVRRWRREGVMYKLCMLLPDTVPAAVREALRAVV